MTEKKTIIYTLLMSDPALAQVLGLTFPIVHPHVKIQNEWGKHFVIKLTNGKVSFFIAYIR